MEPPPPPVLHREGKFGARSGLQRGEFSVFVITSPPPSPISGCSPPCVSNSIVGLLDGDELDEISLCSKIDVVMTLLCLMLVTRA